MYGLAGSLLYVGKAKNLRARLGSYRNARPERVSRKVIRLIHMVDEIRIEKCESEANALLRENELLRQHRPSFNVANTHPESYSFIGLRERDDKTGRWIDFYLTTQPVFGTEEDRTSFFGAFKGRNGPRDSYQALLRLLWASHTSPHRFEYPNLLIREKAPDSYSLQLKAGCCERDARQWASLTRRFLKGTSDALLRHLTNELLAHSEIPPFYYHRIQEDLERLQHFYKWGPARHRKIRRELGLSDHLIAQDRIDDLLILYKERKKQRF